MGLTKIRALREAASRYLGPDPGGIGIFELFVISAIAATIRAVLS